MKQPVELRTALLILFAVSVVAGGGLLYELRYQSDTIPPRVNLAVGTSTIESSSQQETVPPTENSAASTSSIKFPNPTTSTQGWKIYHSTKFGFEVKYPPTWSVTENDRYGQYVGFRNPEWDQYPRTDGYSEVISVLKNITWENAIKQVGFQTQAEAVEDFRAAGLPPEQNTHSYYVSGMIGPGPDPAYEVVVNGMRGLFAPYVNTRLYTADLGVVAGDGQKVMLYDASSAVDVYESGDPDVFNAMVWSLKLL